jgi:exopolysaccharide biosynthesis polyprenyl glycosylphosphotransferase
MTPLTLAFAEAGALFVAGCAAAWPGRAEAAAGPTPLLAGSVLALLGVIAFYYSDLYDLAAVPNLPRFAARLPLALALTLAPLALLHILAPPGMPRGPLAPALALALVAALALLLPLRAAFYRLARRRSFVERVLILGREPLVRTLVAEIEARPNCGYVIAAVAAQPAGAEPGADFHWFGGVDPLSRIIAYVRPDRIVVALSDERAWLPVRQLVESHVLAHTAVENAGEMYERLTGKLAIESMALSSFVFSRDFFDPGIGLAVGRALSVLVAAMGLVVLAPVLALIAAAIKLDSEGPVLFLHDRVGLHGRRFRLIKFRTMSPQRGATSEWVGDNRNRITRVGRWLRTFRLDELPQFVNVLRGDVNLVGPRPHPASNFTLFMDRIPHYWLRFAVRPGITGWAQIRYGYANNLEEETEKMRYDLYYIKHLSPWFDLRILFDTVKTVLLGRGAAAPTAVRLPAVDTLQRSELDPAA